MSGRIVTVEFRNDTLFAVERDDAVYIAVSPICRTLGVNPESQRRRIQGDPVLSEGHALMAFPSVGGVQETLCLKLDLVNGWLMGIDSNRVKAEIRPHLIEYQRECHRVLFQHFYGKATGSAVRPEIDEAKEPISVRLRMVSEASTIFGARAAAELWFRLGLTITPSMTLGPPQLTLAYDKDKPPPDPE